MHCSLSPVKHYNCGPRLKTQYLPHSFRTRRARPDGAPLFKSLLVMTKSTQRHDEPILIDAILPAGGRINGEMAREAGSEIKALLQLDDKTLLGRAIAALRQSSRIHRIVVIGPPELSTHAAAKEADIVLEEGDSGPENIFRGLNWLQENPNADENSAQNRRVLLATTDLPFLTPASIADFLDKCAPQAQICVPVYTRHEFEACFPDEGGEYVRLSDGEWTAGCVFLLDGEALLRNRAHIEDIFAARKSQIAMARLLGPAFIARFLTRRLALSHILSRCEHVLGCRGQIVRGCAPELAFDIDQPNEYRYAVEWAGAAPAAPQKVNLLP